MFDANPNSPLRLKYLSILNSTHPDIHVASPDVAVLGSSESNFKSPDNKLTNHWLQTSLFPHDADDTKKVMLNDPQVWALLFVNDTENPLARCVTSFVRDDAGVIVEFILHEIRLNHAHKSSLIVNPVNPAGMLHDKV